jgi:hypothetical protein
LNADISVTTPFLAATNITAHNISAVNEIQALSINASNIVAESSFSVLSDTLSTSFYTDFVDDEKFVLKVTGVGGYFSTAAVVPAPSPKLAFRTGSTDALLITESGNVSIGARLTATNISANVLHSPVIVSNLITSIDGEIEILNADISVTTPFLAATDIISTNGTFSSLVTDNLIVTGDSTVGPVLNIGFNDNSTTPKTIYFGGLNGDNAYNMAVLESRIYGGSENTELLLFKGNDANQDRIRLRASKIQFDTYTGGTTNRTAEDIRMTITNAGNVGIGTTNPTEPLHVSGNILNTGNIQNNKFRVTQAVTRLTNIYGGGNGEITIANNVGCGGGTLIFYITCGGFATNGGLYSYTFRYKNALGQTRATMTASFFFNQASVHTAWGITQRFTGIPAANMLISIERSSTNLRMDANDFLTIVMEELPY